MDCEGSSRQRDEAGQELCSDFCSSIRPYMTLEWSPSVLKDKVNSIELEGWTTVTVKLSLNSVLAPIFSIGTSRDVIATWIRSVNFCSRFMTSRHARSSARPSKVPPIAQLAEFLLSSLICIPFSLGSHLEAINFKQFPQWTQEQKTVTFDSEGSTQFENGRNMTTDQSITSWVVTDDGSIEKSVPIGLNYSFRVVRRSLFVDSQVRVWDQGTATYI